MANAFYHAVSSARKFGGHSDDYLRIHALIDSSKTAWADQRHRAVFHTSFGIGVIIQIVGMEEQLAQYTRALWWVPQWLRRWLGFPGVAPLTIRTSTGRHVPIRAIAEQHCLEDFGFVPSLEQYLKQLPKETWMIRSSTPLTLKEFT